MTRFAMTLIAAAVLATPMTASAAPKAIEAEVAASTPGAPVPQAQRYCFVDTPTGSHVPRRACKTLADWMAVGVDPRAGK